MRCAAFVVVFLVAEQGTGAPPPPDSRNAALHYWQAFAALPGGKTGGAALSKGQQERLDEWETAPLDETAAAALKPCAAALVQLHRGAAIGSCVWGSQFDHPLDGVGTRCPQVAAAHDVRRAALLRARYRFAHGPPRRALDDLIALVRFARHLETGSTLAGVLVASAIERDVIRVLAANLWALNTEPGLLAAAKAEWDKLPPPRPVTEALADERTALVESIRHQAGVDPDDEPGGTGFIPTLGFILGDETFEEAVATLTGTVDRHHARLGRQITAAGPAEVAAVEKAFTDGWKRDTQDDDPIAVAVAEMLLPAAGKLRMAEFEIAARRALLRAALAVSADGADALKKHHDPFGDGPLTHDPVDGGYELRSALSKWLDKPVTLTVRTARPRE
jgi:hypothetical protein